MMWGKHIGLRFAEDVGIVVVLFGNMGEVGSFVRDGSRFTRDRDVGGVNSKTLCSWKFAGTDKCGCTY